MLPYLAVIASSLIWTVASQMFAHLGREISVIKLSFYKALIACTLFTLVGFTLFGSDAIVPFPIALMLICSGILGYAFADLMVFNSFAKLGPARTMVFVSFGPLLLAIEGYLFLDERLTISQIIGIFFMLLCLIFLSQDKNLKLKTKVEGRANTPVKILLIAGLGVLLDSFGVILSKKSFIYAAEINFPLNSITANIYRTLFPILVVAIIAYFNNRSLSLKHHKRKDLWLIIISTFLGTFMALSLYLYAISKENPAIISAMACMSPIYASIYEHWRDKILPSKNFIVAIIFMLVGLLLGLKLINF
ncbi:MAG: DMT family transporter [Oligoflexia bacterium]|nr:DMT family transporter [Oligoflexia bacterium]